MNLHSAPDSKQTNRQSIIMEAMTGLVYQYGYSKVTMDDIAKASGLSRPALYQFFKNKQEIYRAIARQMFQVSLDQIDLTLSGSGAADERLVQAIMDGKLKMLGEMEATQHGLELLDLGNELCHDLIENFTKELATRFAVIFKEVMGEGESKKATRMAHDLIFWVEGMKTQVKDINEREILLREFVGVQFKAIGGGAQ